MFQWILDNKEWLFSGIGSSALIGILAFLFYLIKNRGTVITILKELISNPLIFMIFVVYCFITETMMYMGWINGEEIKNAIGVWYLIYYIIMSICAFMYILFAYIFTFTLTDTDTQCHVCKGKKRFNGSICERCNGVGRIRH